jgi:hypothetical protein
MPHKRRKENDMKKRYKSVAMTALVAILALGLAAMVLFTGGCGDDAVDDQYGTATTAGDSSEVRGGAGGGSGLGAGTAATDLSAEEEEQLLFLREEEKLARDVYLVLGEKWDVQEFITIAASEVRHMESVKNLLDRYGLTDPIGTDTPGVFTNEDLQAAYDSLIALGSQSVMDAYQVGVDIEEMDITDLEDLIALTTQSDITRVAENLLNGSQNHLAAFTSLLNQ